MIVALTGFMGSGKSCIGKQLADILAYRFIDLDEDIVSFYGMDIPMIVNTLGEEEFRRMESSRLKEILMSTKDNLVLSLGGGTPERNAELIKEKCTVLYLSMNEDTMKARLSDAPSSERPMLQRYDMDELFRKRKSIYESVSDITIQCDGRGIEECAGLCAREIRQRCKANNFSFVRKNI